MRPDIPPDFTLETQYPGPVAGIDEAGRGPWAGPVVAAAVVLDHAAIPDGLDDSKKLTAKRREALYDQLEATAKIAKGICETAEIDELGLGRATDLAMQRAVEALEIKPEFLLIDGRWIPRNLTLPARAVVGGDGRCLSIAAASIIAKVTRDRIMAELAKAHPGYGWETNQGYGTAAHRAGLACLGLTAHHRRSFRPIREILVKEYSSTD